MGKSTFFKKSFGGFKGGFGPQGLLGGCAGQGLPEQVDCPGRQRQADDQGA